MTTAAAPQKKPGLSLGKLSAVAQIALNKPVQAPDAVIELALIDTMPQVRKTFTNLKELAESIKQVGVIEPIIVHAEEGGRFRLISGERRYRAAKLTPMVTIPAIIKRGLSEIDIRTIQIAENNERENLTAYDEALGVIDDVEKFGVQEAIKVWNRGEAWISKRVAVKRYAEPVLIMLKDGLCGDLEVLHCLHQIYEIEPSRTEFYRMRHRFNEGLPLSRDEARNTLARLKLYLKQKKELSKRVEEAGTKKTPAKKKKLAVDADADTDHKGGTAKVSAPEAEDRLQGLSSKELAVIHKRVLDSSDAIFNNFLWMQNHAGLPGLKMEDYEWVLWSSFLAMALPMLGGVGSERGIAYLKKLQVELKTNTPNELLRTLTLERPDGWRF